MVLQYVGQRDTQLIQVHIIHPSLHSKQLAYSTAHVHQSQSKAWILLHQSLLYYFPVYHLDLGVRVGIGGTHYKNWLTKNPHKVSLLDYILGIQCQVSNQYKSPVYIWKYMYVIVPTTNPNYYLVLGGITSTSTPQTKLQSILILLPHNVLLGGELPCTG